MEPKRARFRGLPLLETSGHGNLLVQARFEGPCQGRCARLAGKDARTKWAFDNPHLHKRWAADARGRKIQKSARAGAIAA